MDQVAQSYVRLVLALGKHDENYVDAYYGPPEWRAEVDAENKSLGEIRHDAAAALTDLGEADDARGRNLKKQLESLIARAEMLDGVERTFDEESKALYDVVDPGRPNSFYEKVLAELEPLLPGDGTLNERFDMFRNQFNVPKGRVDDVFRTAVEASREKTRSCIDLPEGESFRIEYVTNKVWSGYNWYQGNAHSLIQVNTDLPITIDRALGLACHEGYPGHHVYNSLLEKHLTKENGWVEFTVYPLYSPMSLIAEGTAEYGVDLTFPAEEALAFERDVLYPLAGLDPAGAEQYSKVRALIGQLGYSSNDASRRYLDGKATHQETIDWLMTYSLSTPERAAQRVRFFEAHRSYVITYNLGEDLVRDYVESRASTYEEKWKVFAELLSTPVTPSALRS